VEQALNKQGCSSNYYAPDGSSLHKHHNQQATSTPHRNAATHENGVSLLEFLPAYNISHEPL